MVWKSDEIVTLVERRKAVSSRHLCISRHIFLSQRICSHEQGNYWATRVRFRLGTPLVTHTTQNDVNTAQKTVLGTSIWILERHVLARYCSNFCPQIDPTQNLWFWPPIKSRAIFFVFSVIISFQQNVRTVSQIFNLIWLHFQGFDLRGPHWLQKRYRKKLHRLSWMTW